MFTHSGKVLTDESHQLSDESHQLTVDLSMKLALRIFFVPEVVIKLGVQNVLLKLFFSLASPAQSQRESSFNDLFSF